MAWKDILKDDDFFGEKELERMKKSYDAAKETMGKDYTKLKQVLKEFEEGIGSSDFRSVSIALKKVSDAIKETIKTAEGPPESDAGMPVDRHEDAGEWREEWDSNY